MVLTDFFYSKRKGLCFPAISCNKDPEHKTYNYFDNETHPTQHIDNTQALHLIKKAKKSFATFKKIKDTHMKNKYIKAGLSPYQIKRYFYLSGDKKFYCIYFEITDGDAVLYFMFGIIERSTAKHLVIVREFWSGSYDALYINHNLFDYYSGDDNMEKTCYPNPPIILSSNTNEHFDKHHEPLDIIDSLEDYFTTLFDELLSLY
ncbi:hypothetical protein QJ856_gp0357 [Tupanvirus deep ocean]|uniref:Uncharacterized protein n=2 Tax=Tupanvirus TaxID=2094720 RepID=A0AC62A9C1_9VIRU|nr:hypothetical protein QJ856_gp0357 [Tupanvirus deep ocean]QKU34381.1 hypothetical protein [Tupanvirus deep ocean]